MRNTHLISVLVVGMVSLATAHATPANLSTTGQTTCTNTEGAVVVCTGTGQDGDYQAGAVSPNPRFNQESVGPCVTDSLTGLMWSQPPDNAPGNKHSSALPTA